MAGAVDKGQFRSGIGIEQVHQTGSAELQYSEVGTQSLPDVPPVVLVDVQPGTQDLESLLNEYRDRATKIARWQAQLQETTDPGMRDYLQGLIDSERATLDTIARNAKDAGASEQELAEIERLAKDAAVNDPIDVEEWDGGESAILAAWIGWRLGELQGTLNTINGVTDIGIGTVNQSITNANPLGQLFGLNPQIPLWDWSRGLITDEDPTLHEWSKWLGGNGVVILGSTFLGMINGKGGPGKIDDATERLSSITKKLRRFETLSLKDQVKEYGNLIKTYRKHLEKYGQKAGQTTGETNRMERELDAMRKLLEGRGRVFGPTGDLLS